MTDKEYRKACNIRYEIRHAKESISELNRALEHDVTYISVRTDCPEEVRHLYITNDDYKFITDYLNSAYNERLKKLQEEFDKL